MNVLQKRRPEGAEPVKANGEVLPWLLGRVPHGYWDSRTNRVSYMRWLGVRLGYRKADDWYAITRLHFQQNHGGGLLGGVYNDSPQTAMQDFMPRRQWWPWLFKRTPQGFWQDIRNRRAFIDYLEERLGIKSKEDWYRVRKQDFADHRGAGLLHNYYGDSVLAAVRELRPRTLWDEWRFDMVPQGYWLSADNLRRYMDWLGEQLGIRTPHLWYCVTAEDVRQHHGITPLTMHGGSVCRLVSAYLPQLDWKPWLFWRAPMGFWQQAENRRAYLVWLGEELGFCKPTDWYALRPHHFKRTGGAALFDMYYGNSQLRAVRERYPTYTWNPNGFRRNGVAAKAEQNIKTA